MTSVTACTVALHADPFVVCLAAPVVVVGIQCEACEFVEPVVPMCASCYDVIAGMYCASCRSHQLVFSEPVSL